MEVRCLVLLCAAWEGHIARPMHAHTCSAMSAGPLWRGCACWSCTPHRHVRLALTQPHLAGGLGLAALLVVAGRLHLEVVPAGRGE